MKRTLVYAGAAAALFLVLIAVAIFSSRMEAALPAHDTRTIQLHGQTIRVSLADTPATRQLGLGGREGLAADEGMLFVFPSDGEYAFWMKDMRFSIDILWLAADGTIVTIAKSVPPESYPKDFSPTSPSRYVMELPANYSDSHEINVGDRVQL